MFDKLQKIYMKHSFIHFVSFIRLRQKAAIGVKILTRDLERRTPHYLDGICSEVTPKHKMATERGAKCGDPRTGVLVSQA